LKDRFTHDDAPSFTPNVPALPHQIRVDR
jgi:hypothetical protein